MLTALSQDIENADLMPGHEGDRAVTVIRSYVREAQRSEAPQTGHIETLLINPPKSRSALFNKQYAMKLYRSITGKPQSPSAATGSRSPGGVKATFIKLRGKTRNEVMLQLQEPPCLHKLPDEKYFARRNEEEVGHGAMQLYREWTEGDDKNMDVEDGTTDRVEQGYRAVQNALSLAEGRLTLDPKSCESVRELLEIDLGHALMKYAEVLPDELTTSIEQVYRQPDLLRALRRVLDPLSDPQVEARALSIFEPRPQRV